MNASDERDTAVKDGVLALVREATHLLRALAAGNGSADGAEAYAKTIGRLSDSVVRPLGEIVGEAAPIDPNSSAARVPELSPSDVARRLRDLATTATTARTLIAAPNALIEATAALQDLACEFAASESREASTVLLSELTALQRDLRPSIQAARNGPLLVTNVDRLDSWLGVPIETRPQMALCRCGASSSKPFCDGSHARTGFSGEKDPNRVTDREDAYEGVAITVLDNRGLCAHSGFCTDRLSTVFRVGEEPFVAASGGRADEIVRAVRDCPSGALGYAIRGVERSDGVDQLRAPGILVSKDGPYRVVGSIELLDRDGTPEPRNAGASLEHFSLCRCGHSQNKPFCSGMHWSIAFTDPIPDRGRVPTLFEWAGGFPALLRTTRIFYERYVPEDELLAPLFSEMSPDHPERVACWLSEVFGGPDLYSARFGGYSRMLSQHLGKALNERQRARWVALLSQSANDARLPNDAEFRAAFVAYLEWGSRLAVENSQPGAKPPPHMPMPKWWWVCNAEPGSRISALAPQPEEERVVLPRPDEPLSFERHIKRLFREQDQRSMRFAFDLWSHDDVATHADAILERVANGTMPCDGRWGNEKVAVFRRWVESGKPA